MEISRGLVLWTEGKKKRIKEYGIKEHGSGIRKA
jgi:hypothetical protein